MHNHEHKVNIKVKRMEGLCIGACLCLGTKEVSFLELHRC
jgi:hypothetical protein